MASARKSSAKTAATAKLADYRAKRDFTRTSEPSGETAVAPSARTRFVIQRHAATRLHYDFRLELDGTFKSWAVARGPSLDPADKRLAVEVEDHPLAYGDFEGTIPKGQYGGGTVQMWDRGYWEVEGAKTAEEGLKAGDFKFQLFGKRLRGSWVLVRLKRREGEKRDNWLLIKHRDAFARSGDADALLAEDKSIASGRSMAEIKAGKGRKPKPFMLSTQTGADAVWQSKPRSQHVTPATGVPFARLPDFVEPQLCRLAAKPPEGTGWAHEIKLDGYRAQLRVERGKATVRTRTGLDWTDKFAAIAASGAKLGDCLVDGEIVALDKAGAPDFPALQNAISDGKTDKLIYFAFDCLFADGRDLRNLPLRARKEVLAKLLEAAPAKLRLVGHLEQPGGAVLHAAREMALEGIISKKLSAPYQSGRADSWLKLKTRPGQEIVIGGWSEENGRFRSLLAGAYDKGRLIYLGRVGTGFGDATVKQLLPKLRAVATAASPFTGPGAPPKEADVRWASPTLVAEVEFGGWSSDGLLRQAAFKGLRDDKSAQDVRREVAPAPAAAAANTPRTAISSTVRKPENAPVRGVALSHGGRILWPAAADTEAITKRDLALYYERIGDWLLTHVKGRPCSIVRAPDGIGGQTFFQRHAVQGGSELFTLVEVSGDKKPYVQFDTVEALVAAAQVSTVEMHPWNCQPGSPETPGRLVFDFDPAPDVAFDRVVEAAREMKDRLAALGLESFCKTTGGKGLHVVTPFAKQRADLKWPEAKAFAQEVCRRMAADSPDRYLITMSKKDRMGRIFLDYLRNDRTSTAVAPLSPRARDGAPVSMPVTWKQVRFGLDPQRFTLRTAPGLLARSKAWDDYHDGARPFAAAAKKLAAKK